MPLNFHLFLIKNGGAAGCTTNKQGLYHFSMIPNHRDKDASALAVAIGKEKDFSDVKLVYHIVIKKKLLN
jgi:hypothetical protein